MIKLILLTLISVNVFADPIPLYTRRIGEITGNPNHPSGVKGQDSPVIQKYKDKILFHFGDTLFHDGRFFHPNSLATTKDFDATDGVELTYYDNNKHRAALGRVKGEFSVWFSGTFQIGNDLFATYSRVKGANPIVLGKKGIAYMKDGKPPYRYTSFDVEDTDPLYDFLGSAVVHKGYVYFYGRVQGYLTTDTYLARAPVGGFMMRNKYEFWTDQGWSKDATNKKAVLHNGSTPRIHYNKKAQKWFALSNLIYSEYGFVAAFALYVSENLEGPWSDPLIIYGSPFPKKTEEIYPVYNVDWHPAFGDNGKLYSFATRHEGYNIHSFETSFWTVSTKFEVLRKAHDMGTYIDASGKNTVKLKLTGQSYFNAQNTKTSKFVLPVTRDIFKNRKGTIKIAIGTPNSKGFPQNILGEIEVPYNVPAGSKKLVLDNKINSLLDQAYAHEDWMAGEKNRILLYLSRSDNNRQHRLSLESFETGKPASIDMCFGVCN